MAEALELIRRRQSTRGPFDPDRPISENDLLQILEAARWAPTAHNMQNFEIVVVEDKKLLEAISGIRSPMSETFIRENYRQLSFSEEELKKKKVGLLGTMFPPELRNPEAKTVSEHGDTPSFQSRLIRTSPVLLIVVYDPARRAPASDGDFLGIISLGCVMENMWLTAHSLGIGFQVLSTLSADPVEREVKDLLRIPAELQIAFSVRLGYPAGPIKYLRVRRDINDYTHYNRFDESNLGKIRAGYEICDESQI